MSNSTEASTSTKLKTGIFVLCGLGFLGALTVYVNNRPFWWRTCEAVQVTIEDATGLKKKSPVKSLGLEIGYISDIGLVSNGVKLKVCVTAPVEVQPATKAYVRSEGFLGDKFLELKPVKYVGSHMMEDPKKKSEAVPSVAPTAKEEQHSSVLKFLGELFIPSAGAQEVESGKNIPVGEKSTDMQALMQEMQALTKSLKDSINPDEIRGTIRQLNKTLEDASKALSPQGGLTQTAQRSLIKLEDAIEQMRDQITRINQGQGSVGMVLNDPFYADELKKAILSVNKLLGRASELRMIVNLGISQLDAFNAARASFELQIWPKADRYYLIGLDSDPRGRFTQSITTTQVAGTSYTNTTTVQDFGGFMFSAMIGKVFYERLDFAVGLLHGDGAASLGLNLGPSEYKTAIQLKGDLYFRAQTVAGQWSARPDTRITALIQPFSIFYVSGGIEGFRKVNDKLSIFYGGGIRFNDEDIKLLISFL